VPNIKDDIAVLSRALDLRTQRHQALASNVANADTPNYKARDLNFQDAMQQAMTGLKLTTTSASHLPDNQSSGLAKLQYRSESQSAVDGNTVDMDVERAQLADNALQYQILTQLIADQFKGMKTALSSNQG
jgi:flagellar basal-body rod protein FlgB